MKLRNELVDEYPLAPSQRLERLRAAHSAIAMLEQAAERAARLVAHRKWITA